MGTTQNKHTEMAEKLIKNRLYIRDITQNGLRCKEYDIEIDSQCVTISCEGEDSKGRWIEFQALENCTPCFDIKVDCKEECDVCPPVVRRFCLCDDKNQCEECQDCVDGFCQDRCPDQLCVNDTCVDCKDDEDCPCNLVCRNNRCVCPTGLKLNPDTGCCEECSDNSDCDICEICQDGNCIPKCPGACDNQGNCQECINSGDCQNREDGRNCCGDNNQCECCPGFCYDPVAGRCLPCPDCKTDNDCPVCFQCIGDECVPIVCPEGYICIGDECVPICNCDQPTCSRTAACVPYTSDICICVECEGNCEEGCSIGCYCNPETNKCEPNPCDKPCTTGADCDLGCGCDPDTNRCVPCADLDCVGNDCDRVDGCKCFGNTCIGDPCNGPCQDGNDCGEGCGCKDGNCVSCDKLNCDECANVLGCECDDNVNCTPVDPCSGPCVTPRDCPKGCTCYEGECTPCANFDCDNCPIGCDCDGGSCGKTGNPEDPCEDDFTLERNSDDGQPCDLVATLVTDECCSCPKIEVRTRLNGPVSATNVDLLGYTVEGRNLTYNLQLFKNGILLGNTGIINEKPLSGVFEASIDVSWRLNSGGTITSGTIANYATVTGDISGEDTLNLGELQVPNIGTLNSELEVTDVQVRIRLVEDLVFPNECVYDAVQTVASYDNYQIGIVRSYELTNNSCRLPIFEWYRNTTGSGFGSGNRFRRIYAERVNSNTYRDRIVDCHDGLYSGFFYRVTSDCTCATAPVEQAIFCQDVLNFRYELEDCGTKLTVTNIDIPCDVNGNLSAQGCTDIPSGAQVTWKLRITTEDGVEHNVDYIQPDGTPSLSIGDMITTDAPIILVEFIHSDDSSCAIREVETGGVDFDVVADCEDGGRISVFLPSTGSFNVVINDGTSDVETRNGVNGTQDFTNLGYGGVYTVTVTGGGCSAEKTVGIPTQDLCCPTYTCSATYNGNNVSISVSPIDASLTYSYTVNGAPYVLGTPITLSNGANNYTVTDSNGCTCSGTFNVDNCPNVTINANRNFDPLTNTLLISNITGGTPNYTVNIGGIVATNVPPTGQSINVAALAEGTYTVTITDSEGCFGSFSIVIDRPDPCDNSNLSIAFTPASYNCDLNELLITVSGGTAPYTLEVEDNFGPIGGALQDLGGGDYRVYNLPDRTYTATATDANGCKLVRTFVVDCACNNPLIIDTISADCDGNDHVISIPGGITGGDIGPIFLTVSSAPSGAGTEFYNAPVASGTNITVTIPAAQALLAGQNYYLYAIDSTGKCTAQDSVQAPDCTASCEYDLGGLTCAGDGAQVWMTATPLTIGSTNNCNPISNTAVVSATINGSAANVQSVNFQGGQVVIVPNQALVCPTNLITQVVINLTINDLAPITTGACECTDQLPIVINKTYTSGDIPDCSGSCP